MDTLIHVPSAEDSSLVTHAQEQFKLDIQQGLEGLHKSIPSKYFYDAYGSELFNKITRHPDYYLTNCELEILNTCKRELANLICDAPFNLIELGPGEGVKSRILLEQFLQHTTSFSYMPIDISLQYLENLQQRLHNLPALAMTSIHADYFKGLEWIKTNSQQRNFVLFLGSSIGNYNLSATDEFLRQLWAVLNDGDYVLLGFDLRKDIDALMRAYDDSDGLTKAFNLNLLSRLNRELGANFKLDKFKHYATYNVYDGAMESYLISRQQQVVQIDALSKRYIFSAFEPMQLECSYKYLLTQVTELAETTGFNVIKNYLDSKEYFVDTLWQVTK